MARLIINIKLIYIVSCYIQGILCDFIDPGQMFDPGDSSIERKHDEDRPKSSFPFLWTSSDEAWFSEDSTCSTGTSVVLKRIVRKLFDHLDSLQPNELDNEFIYQSALSYEDYSNMLSYLKNGQLSCANLHKLESILSKFITTAKVSRFGETKLFGNFIGPSTFDPKTIVESLQYFPDAGLITIILIVCLTKWFFKSLAGYSDWKSYLLALIIPGFIQFYKYQHRLSMNDHQEKLDRCLNRSNLNLLLSYFWDYNNCQTTTNSRPPDIFILNIAVVGVQYISELVFHPIIIFPTKFGQASQSYMSSFSGWVHFTLAPFFLVLLYICLTVAVMYIIKCLSVFYFAQSWSKSTGQRTNKPARLANNRPKQLKK